MPRIRKQTSNRGTTHQRSKIGQKAAETRKKNRRSTKKDVTWKSKKPKDIGIPNSFPYKAEVLAEIAAQRQLNEEEKIRLKEERRASYKAASLPEPPLEDEDEIDPLGVNTLVGTRVKSKVSKAAPVEDDENSDAEMEDDVAEDDDEEVSGAPLLFDSELPTLQAALEKADVLLEVVDARDPLGFRSPWLEELFCGEDEEGNKGKVIIVLTKIDLVPREALQQWLLFLRPRFITILFKSRLPVTHNLGPTPKTIKNAPMFPVPLSAAKKAEEEDRRMRLSHSEVCGREELLEVLERWAGEKKAAGKEEEFVVVVAGLPNVGKSSLLNTLLESTHFPIAHYPPTSLQSKVTTTTPAGTIYTSPSSSTQIKFVDTPGWIFADVFPGDDEEELDDEDDERSETEEEAEMWEVIEGNRVRDLLRRNLGRVDRIKEPIPLAEYIIAHASTSDLMLLYSTPAFLASDPSAFLTSLARVQGRLKKHGVPDLDAAARIVLRDWSLSQFPYYTLPAKGATLSPRVPAEVETLSLFAGEKEEKILARVRTRREMITEKGGRGVVKMQSDEVFEGVGDKREVVLDDELRQEGEDDSEGSDEEGGDWEDDDEEEDEDMEIEGEEVFAEDDGEEPIDSEVEDDDEPEDASLPSMLDLINAAATSSKSSKKRSAPPPSSAPTASSSRPSKKTAVTIASSSKPVAAPSPASKKVVFASQPKGKTPRGNGVVDDSTPPTSILKVKPTAPAPAPVAASSKKNGKKAAAAPAPAAPVVPTPAIGADAVELKKSGAEGRKEKKKVETKEKKEKKEKHGKIAAPAAPVKKAAEPVKKATSSKAADRAKTEKGEQPYSFDSHFF